MASQASATASKADVARRFMQLREISPANSRCAECHAADTSWVVLDYGVLTCVHCAGCHRGLGTHISKVRSSQHDDFTPAELDWIESQGNEKSAQLYEGALPPTMRRPSSTSDCPDVVRRTWLRTKYDQLRFTAGLDRHALAPHESLSGWVQLKEGSGLLSSWRRRFVRVRGGALLEWYSGEVSSASADGTDEETLAMTLLKGTLLLANAALIVDPDEPQHLRIRNGARGTGGGPSLLQLRCPSYDTAEAWAWAIYQCSHGAAIRCEERPELLQHATMMASSSSPGTPRASMSSSVRGSLSLPSLSLVVPNRRRSASTAAAPPSTSKSKQKAAHQVAVVHVS